MSERIVAVVLAAVVALGAGCASAPQVDAPAGGAPTPAATTIAVATTTTTVALESATRSVASTAVTPPPARPELTTTTDPDAQWRAYLRTRLVLRTVFEPYGRWGFSGIQGPVVGDCFLGGPCPFELDDLFTPEAQVALAERAATSAVDPVSCTTGAILLAEGRSIDQRPFLVYGSWNGETVEEPIRIEMDAATQRISDVVCSAITPAGAGGMLGPVPPTPAGARHTVAEGLALVWDLFVLDEEINLTRCVGGDPSCEADLDDWFTAACQLDLRRKYDAVQGMASVIGGGQNITRIVGRSNLRLDGHLLSLDAETWWGHAIPVTVDLDRLRIMSLGPHVPLTR